MSERLIQDLRDPRADENVVVIVGAGVSIAATHGAAVASWEDLLFDGRPRCVDLGTIGATEVACILGRKRNDGRVSRTFFSH